MAHETGASGRAYQEIKQLILSGRLAVRARIDIEKLARGLSLSATPVRQALALLVGERLVRPGRQAGYEVALWTEAELAHLYEWRGVLLGLALPSGAAGSDLMRTARTQPYPQAALAVMRLLDEGANPELRRAAINSDDRLFLARAVEAEVLGDVDGEFETLIAAIAERSKRANVLLRAYHRRRIQQAGRLRERVVLRALPNNGTPPE